MPSPSTTPSLRTRNDSSPVHHDHPRSNVVYINPPQEAIGTHEFLNPTVSPGLTGPDFVGADWARRWPSELVWKVHKI